MGKISFIGGSEPYLVDCQKIMLVGQFEVKELNYLESSTFDDAVYSFLFTYPMGDDRKVAYITVDSLGEMNTPLFEKYKKNPSDFGELIVRFRNHDGRENFFYELKKEGILQMFDKESVSVKLSELINNRAIKKGAAFTDAKTLALFLQRENYSGRDDITLYNILNDLNNLIAINKTITREMVLSVVPENASEQVFGIARMITNKNISELRQQAVLCSGNKIGTLSALLREYRIAYKALYFPAAEIGATRFAFKGLSKEQLLRGIDIVTEAVDAYKHNKMPRGTLLEQTFLKLTYEYSIEKKY